MALRRTLVGLLAVTAISAVTIAALGPNVYFVSSDSMRPTLEGGDIVLCISRLTIRRGSVVAIADEPEPETVSAKRIIAIDSDTVEYVDKVLKINGVEIQKNVLERLPMSDPMDLLLEQSLDGSTFEILEALGRPLIDVVSTKIHGYYVLGDNRDNSTDSRNFGPVDSAQLRCRIVAVLGSTAARGFSFKPSLVW